MPTRFYRNYVLLLLMVVYIFNFIDRQVLVIVQEQIRDELGLMDWGGCARRRRVLATGGTRDRDRNRRLGLRCAATLRRQ